MSKRDEAYRLAVEAAQAELMELKAKLADMEPLLRRKAMVEAFIKNLTLLQAGNTPKSPAAGNRMVVVRAADAISVGSSTAVAITPGRGKNIWEGAHEVLAEAKHPMIVPWIVRMMRDRGWNFEAKWTNEIVRGAIQRKSDIFEALGHGFYALKEWPSEMKKVSRDIRFKARHNIHPAATVQSIPDQEDLIVEKK